MSKFTLKFFLLFVILMSVSFFSLILFQEHKMELMHENFILQNQIYEGMVPVRPEAPPIIVPFVVILFLGFLFVFFLLKYLDRNFIFPLNLIKENLNKVKNGRLDIIFQTKSENRDIKNIFDTLNDMILGLMEKERLQDDFIQNLIHDIKAPLTAQKRAISILKDEFKGHWLIDGLSENNEAYFQMINLILEAFSKKDIEINKTEFDFVKMTDTIFLTLKPLFDEKNIKFLINVKSPFVVYADYTSLNRIFMNLISNAIENAGCNIIIKISAEHKDGKVLLMLEDNGTGIDEADKEHIFNKYFSNKKNGTKAISGLGLYIAKELAEKNGGTISLESKKGEYTRFLISLKDKC